MKTTALLNPFTRCAALLCAALAFINPFTRAAAAPRLPAIYAFNVAAEATINLGTTTFLNWQVGDATSVTLAPLGDVTGKSWIEISPTVTTTYVLTATNSAGSVSKSKKITVIVPPVFQSLAATPDSINSGGASTLSWSAPGANYFTVTADNDADPGNVFANSVVVRPKITTTYTVVAVNTAGTNTRTITLPVAAPLPKPTISSFTAAPSSVVGGSATTLSWAVNGATSLSISPAIGAVTGTSVVVTPTATTAYTLTATNSTGSVTKKTTVTVTASAPLPVISSFTATPNAIVAGAPSTLAWSANGATSFTITADVGASPGLVTGASVVVTPIVNTTYTLAAINATGSVTKTVSITVTPPAPVINSFTASPGTITKGDSTTLAWSVAGADTLTLTPAIGNVFGSNITIKPTATVDYVLTATNAGGSVTKTVTVTVNTPVPLPTIASFTANPNSIVSGNSTTLAWSVAGADSLSIAADTGASPGAVTGTSRSVSPTANTTYTLTATNVSGSVTKTVSVAVSNPVPPPVIVSFTASPGTIALGGALTLNWSVTGATSLTIASDVGASPGAVTGASGVIAVNPTAATNYTLTATNDSGSITKSVKVTVNDPAPVIGSFASIPNTINAGETARIIWSVSGAASLSITADRGPNPGVVTGANGSLNVTPVTTTSYVMTATSPVGVVSHSLTQVSVLAAPPLPVPVIASFEASPDEISLGSSTTLTWSINAADTISIAADHGTSPGVVTGTSVTVSPTVDTVYTVTATNTFGNSTTSVDVTVHGPSAPIIGSFFATPAFIKVGDPSTLNWTISGADSISIAADHGTSPGAVTGTSFVVNPTETTTYTLTATNAIGSSTAIVPVTIFTPGSVTHPRIWVTPASAATLNIRAAANDPAWIKLRNECDAYAAMPVQFPDEVQRGGTINGGYQYNDYLQPSETLALGYVAAKTADPVRAARYAAKERELLLKLSDPVHHGRPTTDSGYSIRSYVPALALGYDWIFETLGETDRVQIYTEINRWVASYEATGFGRSYPTGNYFAGYYAAKPLGALATEGENPLAPGMWDDWLNRVHYGMVQPYHQQWLSGGGAPDGWNYGQFETINMLRPIAAAFTAKGLDLIHDAKPFSYVDGNARWIAHFTWPDLKSVSDRGFVYNGNTPSWTDAGWATQYNGFLRLANGSNAPLMQRYALDVRAVNGTGDVEAWAEFLLHSNTAPAADYRTALSYQTNGDGQVAMRSAWATDAVWAAFQAGPYTGYPSSSEEFFDEGALTIQRGNVQFLVNTWGAMMRNTPGTDDGDPVFNNLYNELFQTQSDGVNSGRRIFNTYYAPRATGYWGQIGNTPFDHSTTTLSKFEDGGSYVLMRGTHLEDQYYDDSPISSWTRNVAYVRPQLFVVYDRTTIKNAATDNWMAWHVGPKPVVRTDSATGTRAFDVTDTRAAFGGNLFRGRVSTVFPAGNVVSNVDVFGRGKVYRLEVRPASPVAANTWLTVFDASASTAAAKNAAALTATVGGTIVAEGTLISGGNGSNVVVLFSKSGNAIAGTLSAAIPAADTYLLANDLQPNASYAVTATLANGTLTLQVAPGSAFTTTAHGTLALNVSAIGAITAP